MFEMSPRVLFWAATACYAVAFLLFTWSLRVRKSGFQKWATACDIAGFIGQGVGMAWVGVQAGGCPIGGVFEILLFFVWSLLALQLLLAGIYRSAVAGAMVSFLAFAAMTVALMLPAGKVWVSGAGNKVFLSLHGALGVFSYGILGMLALSAVMYLWQVGSLRRRNPETGMADSLPSVRVLERVNLRLLLSGVILLGVSLGVGIWEWQAGVVVGMTKAAWGGAVFLLYALLLILRMKERLLARRFSWACVLLFIVVLASLYFVHRGVAMGFPGEVSA